MAEEKWYFTKEQLADSPSRRYGIDAQQESKYRQQAADLIQNMGQALMVSQLCINTAIVYMHRFYAFHSFTHFHRNHIAAASLFLAAKVEEQPRKLQSVIEAGHNCLYPKSGRIDVSSEHFLEQTQDLIFNENILLQTLGFDVAIDHPHTHVVKTCNLVRASKDLAQSSYFMASNTLHKTTMCLQYKPTVVACFCIHVACKWSNWQIPQSKEGKHWFEYVDTSVTTELLDRLTLEFLHYFDTKSSSDRARSDMNQERDRKALAAQEEAHHRQHPQSSRSMHVGGHPGHSSQSLSHASAGQHRPHGQHKVSSIPHMGQSSSYSQQHPNHHSSSNQPHYNSQNPSMIQGSRDPHKKIDEKTKHQLDYNKMQNINRPRLPPEAMANKNMHNRHKPEMYPPHHNAYIDRGKDIPENYQNRMLGPDQRSSTGMPRVDPYKNEKEMKLKPNPQISMEMKKREFNSLPKTNINEYVFPNVQKPPPNYHEYKNQNNQSSISKHNLPNNNKLLMKPEIKPTINTMPLLEEPVKVESVKTPTKPSIFSPDNKDTSFYKKSKTEPRTPNKKPSLSPNGRKIETPKRMDIRPQERTPSQQIIKSENKVKSANSAMRLTDTPTIPTIANNPNIPRPLSPFISPLKKSNSSTRNRTRTSSSSDAELVPVIKKLEDTSDYGDFFRSKLSPQIDDEKVLTTSNIIKPMMPEISTANGIETNPDLISSLLKESLLGLDNSNSTSANTLQLSMTQTVPNVPNTIENQPAISDDFKHKSEKKKKKDKHKHKDKTKEERKKHKKDKERLKDRQVIEMNPAQTIPIKITIPKDKIDMPPEPSIKIKIPKEKIKSLPRNDSGVIEQRPVQGLKIKISKEAVDNYTENSKKRERALSADRGPPPKSTRTT